MKRFLIPLFLMSCSHLPSSNADISHSPRKQKQRIASLEKRIAQAEEEWNKKGLEVELLKAEKKRTEILMIRSKVEQYEEELRAFREGRGKLRKEISFFEERETLHRLVQEGPSPTSYEAQLLLDQLLRIITQWSAASL